MLANTNDIKKSLQRKYRELKKLRIKLEVMEANFIEDLSNHFDLELIIKTYDEGIFDPVLHLDYFVGDGYGITLDGENHNTVANIIDCIHKSLDEQVKVLLKDTFY